MGRISPHLVVQDAVVPRTRLPDGARRDRGDRRRASRARLQRVPRRRRQPASEHRLRRATTPTKRRACTPRCGRSCRRASTAGGTITGEHGVGLDKLDVHGRDLLAGVARARCARCARCSIRSGARIPGKVVPVHSCREWHGAPSAARTRDVARERTSRAGNGSRSAIAERDPRARARSRGTPLRIVGGGTWLDAGRPVRRRAALARSAHARGIVDVRARATSRSPRAPARRSPRSRARRPREGSGSRSIRAGRRRRHARRHGRHRVGGPARARFGTPRDHVLGSRS